MNVSEKKKFLPAWMLGSIRAARSTTHVFISLSLSLTSFTPESFKGCLRPLGGLQGLGWGGLGVSAPSSQWDAAKGTWNITLKCSLVSETCTNSGF